MTQRLYFVAGEASGDVLGQDVAATIAEYDPSVLVRATGVTLTGESHQTSDIGVEQLSVLGIWEGLRAYGAVKRIVAETVQDILRFKPAVVVLIDSWGFTLRVAQALRAADSSIRLVKLIGPQVWATRPGRARVLANAVDHLLCIHSFEVPYYAPHGLKTTVIGHPAFARFKPGDAARFLDKQGLSADAPIVAVFPGSRPSEISRMGQPILEAAELLVDRNPSLKIAFAPADAVAADFWALERGSTNFIKVSSEDRFDLMATCDVALACSGTIVTEIALQGAPVVTGYRSGVLTWFVATRFLLQSDYITLLNVAAGREVIPEFIQYAFNPNELSAAVNTLLSDQDQCTRQIEHQNEALAKMGFGGPSSSEISAQAILAELASASAGV